MAANKFSSAFDPPTPGTTGVSPIKSVQGSLYQRLKKTHGDKAGELGWCLVRAGQPEHREHADALAELGEQPSAALSRLLTTVRMTVTGLATKPPAMALAQSIVDELQHIIDTKAGQAMVDAMSPEDQEQMVERFRRKTAT